ncbi:MAG: hypothetical protein ACLFVR_06575 [Thiohalospira sp.]
MFVLLVHQTFFSEDIFKRTRMFVLPVHQTFLSDEYYKRTRMLVLLVYQTFLSDDNLNEQECLFYQYIRHSCLMII